jgi:NTP pyrophosphatase (non-canonical NTP hydrolase)
MNLSEFQAFFIKHQENYKIDENNRLALMTLGLAGECGEVIELVKKDIRDGVVDKKKVAEELGDVMAYLAIVAEYYGYDLDEIAQMVIDKNVRRVLKGTLQTSGENRD